MCERGGNIECVNGVAIRVCERGGNMGCVNGEGIECVNQYRLCELGGNIECVNVWQWGERVNRVAILYRGVNMDALLECEQGGNIECVNRVAI